MGSTDGEMTVFAVAVIVNVVSEADLNSWSLWAARSVGYPVGYRMALDEGRLLDVLVVICLVGASALGTERARFYETRTCQTPQAMTRRLSDHYAQKVVHTFAKVFRHDTV
jgi:hypothetical protein